MLYLVSDALQETSFKGLLNKVCDDASSELFVLGSLVNIHGKIRLYNEKKQIIVSTKRKSHLLLINNHILFTF